MQKNILIFAPPGSCGFHIQRAVKRTPDAP